MEYLATVKSVHAGGYGFLENPMPGGKDIFIAPRKNGPPLKEGLKVLVIRDDEQGTKGPRVIEWGPSR